MKADSDLMKKYWGCSLKEKVGEVFTGHEGLGMRFTACGLFEYVEYK